MDSFVPHLRLSLRKLVRAPLFSLTTVGTLALGIGANTAIFSVVNGVLLAPLPFEGADELVGVSHTAPGIGFPTLNMSPANYYVYKERSRYFDRVGIWDNSGAAITGRNEPERVRTMLMTHDVLPMLRVQPHLGRVFTENDDSPDSPLTVMLGFAYWRRAFAGERTALGEILTIDGEPHEVIGVMPREFELPRGIAQLYLPLRLDRSEVFLGNFDYQGIARLTPGATVEQANADLETLIFVAAEEFPGGISVENLREARFGGAVQPLKTDYIGDIGSVLWVLLGTVGIVLLIACANVANLFLVRAERRHREIAVRSALGASRSEIARQFLSESVLLGVFGGLVGLALAFAGLKVLIAIGPDSLPRLNQIRIDRLVLGFTMALSVFAGLFLVSSRSRGFAGSIS